MRPLWSPRLRHYRTVRSPPRLPEPFADWSSQTRCLSCPIRRSCNRCMVGRLRCLWASPSHQTTLFFRHGGWIDRSYGECQIIWNFEKVWLTAQGIARLPPMRKIAWLSSWCLGNRLLQIPVHRTTLSGIFIAFILFAGASAAETPKLFIAPDGSLIVDGTLTPELAKRFHAMVSSPQVRRVRISSFGGDDLSALSMAQDIKQRGLPVVVSRACMSACASYIFLLASSRQVMPDSLVVFHHNRVSLFEMLSAEERSRVAPSYLETERWAQQQFQNSGVEINLLFQPQRAIHTLCNFLGRVKGGHFDEVLYVAQFRGWIPSREFLANSGIAVTGFWPASPGDVEHAWKHVFPPDMKFRIVFGGPHTPASLPVLFDYLRRIPRCTTPKGAPLEFNEQQ